MGHHSFYTDNFSLITSNFLFGVKRTSLLFKRTDFDMSANLNVTSIKRRDDIFVHIYLHLILDMKYIYTEKYILSCNNV